MAWGVKSLIGTSKNLLCVQTAALCGARDPHIFKDIFRSLCAVALAFWPLVTVFRGALMFAWGVIV